jgi:hypothetical protein
MVTPAGFEPAISTLKGSGPHLDFRELARLLPRLVAITDLFFSAAAGL